MKFTTNLTREQHAILRAIAARRNQSINATFDQLINEILSIHNPARMREIPVFDLTDETPKRSEGNNDEGETYQLSGNKHAFVT